LEKGEKRKEKEEGGRKHKEKTLFKSPPPHALLTLFTSFRKPPLCLPPPLEGGRPLYTPLYKA